MRPHKPRALALLLLISGVLVAAALLLRPLIASARNLSQAQLPEIEYRDLGIEITAIYEIENIMFLLTTHTFDDIEDLIAYQRLQEARLESLDSESPLFAQVAFKMPLSLVEVEDVLGAASVSSLRYVSSPSGGGQLPYPVSEEHIVALEAWQEDLKSQYGDDFEILVGFTAAEIRASPSQLMTIAQDPRTFLVDAGATDLLGQFANAVSLSDNDVAYSYEEFVGSACTLQDLARITDELAAQGFIDDGGIHRSLQNKLDNAKKALDRGGTIPAANMVEAYINEVEAQRGTHIDTAAADELVIIADCVAVRIAEGR